eukprot:TRINITY_DN40706_c0_g1_i1.p2 TRINITY_DN40706_c0_g1~~TRINITY_DN40706_c0_g1_i1.p2  ORF type:complete len:130 (-),score=0.37 TRINITY_DN40706_c0_g1_i1:323-712(-)
MFHRPSPFSEKACFQKKHVENSQSSKTLATGCACSSCSSAVSLLVLAFFGGFLWRFSSTDLPSALFPFASTVLSALDCTLLLSPFFYSVVASNSADIFSAASVLCFKLGGRLFRVCFLDLGPYNGGSLL